MQYAVGQYAVEQRKIGIAAFEPAALPLEGIGVVSGSRSGNGVQCAAFEGEFDAFDHQGSEDRKREVMLLEKRFHDTQPRCG